MPQNFEINLASFPHERITHFFKLMELLRQGEDIYSYVVDSVELNDVVISDKYYSVSSSVNEIIVSWQPKKFITVIPTVKYLKSGTNIYKTYQGLLLEAGKNTMLLNFTSLDPNDTSVEWASSNSSFASVSSSGLVTALKQTNIVTITGKGTNSGEIGTIDLTISEDLARIPIYQIQDDIGKLYVKETDVFKIRYSVYSSGKFIRNAYLDYVIPEAAALRGQFTFSDNSLERIVRELGIEDNLAQLTFSERQKALEYFKTIIDVPAFMTEDHRRLRRMILDWYSVNKTNVTQARVATDPFSLSGQELNELIESFGFPYPHELGTRDNKATFLLQLIDFYHKKGTPDVLKKVLGYFGLHDVVISEWWIRKRETPQSAVHQLPYIRLKFIFVNFLLLILEGSLMDPVELEDSWTDMISGGRLTEDNLVFILYDLDGYPEHIVRHFFREVDTNETGYISYDSLMEYLRNEDEDNILMHGANYMAFFSYITFIVGGIDPLSDRVSWNDFWNEMGGMPFPRTFFDVLDTDHDGELTLDDCWNNIPDFEVFGLLFLSFLIGQMLGTDHATYATLVGAMGADYIPESVFNRMDHDGDGTLTFPDILADISDGLENESMITGFYSSFSILNDMIGLSPPHTVPAPAVPYNTYPNEKSTNVRSYTSDMLHPGTYNLNLNFTVYSVNGDQPRCQEVRLRIFSNAFDTTGLSYKVYETIIYNVGLNEEVTFSDTFTFDTPHNCAMVLNFDAVIESYNGDEVTMEINTQELFLVYSSSHDFYAKSQPIVPANQRNNTEYMREMTYADFIDGDPYWRLTEDQLEYGYLTNVIGLPSITPIISIEGAVSLLDVTPGLAILSRKMQETYEYWIEYVLIPSSNVTSEVTTPPDSPTNGDIYLIGDSADTNFLGRDGQIATYSDGWLFTTPEKNWVVLNVDTDTHYVWNEEEWVDLGVRLPAVSSVDEDTSGKLNTSKSGDFYKNVYLTKINGAFSFLEVMLSIGNLFNDIVPEDVYGFLTADNFINDFTPFPAASYANKKYILPEGIILPSGQCGTGYYFEWDGTDTTISKPDRGDVFILDGVYYVYTGEYKDSKLMDLLFTSDMDLGITGPPIAGHRYLLGEGVQCFYPSPDPMDGDPIADVSNLILFANNNGTYRYEIPIEGDIINLDGAHYIWTDDEWQLKEMDNYPWKEIQFDNKRFLMYNGASAPFDEEDTLTGIRDDVDDDPEDKFRRVFEEYEELSFTKPLLLRHTPNKSDVSRFSGAILNDSTEFPEEVGGVRSKWDKTYGSTISGNVKSRHNLLQDRTSNFTEPLDYYDSTSFFTLLKNPSTFLRAMNKDFKNELEYFRGISNDQDLVESIMKDFEDYLKEVLGIIDVPLSYIVLGLDFYSKLFPIIDFFKPFRVRVKEFITSYKIDDPLGDYALLIDEFHEDLISQFMLDKGFWSYDDLLDLLGHAKDEWDETWLDVIKDSLYSNPYREVLTRDPIIFRPSRYQSLAVYNDPNHGHYNNEIYKFSLQNNVGVDPTVRWTSKSNLRFDIDLITNFNYGAGPIRVFVMSRYKHVSGDESIDSEKSLGSSVLYWDLKQHYPSSKNFTLEIPCDLSKVENLSLPQEDLNIEVIIQVAYELAMHDDTYPGLKYRSYRLYDLDSINHRDDNVYYDTDDVEMTNVEQILGGNVYFGGRTSPLNFSDLGESGNDRVTYGEVQEYFPELGNDLNAFFEILDPNGDGYVSKAEFEILANARYIDKSREELIPINKTVEVRTDNTDMVYLEHLPTEIDGVPTTINDLHGAGFDVVMYPSVLHLLDYNISILDEMFVETSHWNLDEGLSKDSLVPLSDSLISDNKTFTIRFTDMYDEEDGVVEQIAQGLLWRYYINDDQERVLIDESELANIINMDIEVILPFIPEVRHNIMKVVTETIAIGETNLELCNDYFLPSREQAAFMAWNSWNGLMASHVNWINFNDLIEDFILTNLNAIHRLDALEITRKIFRHLDRKYSSNGRITSSAMFDRFPKGLIAFDLNNYLVLHHDEMETNGYLTYSEALVTIPGTSERAQISQELFNDMDIDGDGKLGITDLVGSYGLPIYAYILLIPSFAQLDANHDGYLSYEETGAYHGYTPESDWLLYCDSNGLMSLERLQEIVVNPNAYILESLTQADDVIFEVGRGPIYGHTHYSTYQSIPAGEYDLSYEFRMYEGDDDKVSMRTICTVTIDNPETGDILFRKEYREPEEISRILVEETIDIEADINQLRFTAQASYGKDSADAPIIKSIHPSLTCSSCVGEIPESRLSLTFEEPIREDIYGSYYSMAWFTYNKKLVTTCSNEDSGLLYPGMTYKIEIDCYTIPNDDADETFSVRTSMTKNGSSPLCYLEPKLELEVNKFYTLTYEQVIVNQGEDICEYSKFYIEAMYDSTTHGNPVAPIPDFYVSSVKITPILISEEGDISSVEDRLTTDRIITSEVILAKEISERSTTIMDALANEFSIYPTRDLLISSGIIDSTEIVECGPPVKEIITALPDSPSDGDRYIMNLLSIPSATELGNNIDNYVVTYNETTGRWSKEEYPSYLDVLFNEKNATYYMFNNNRWVKTDGRIPDDEEMDLVDLVIVDQCPGHETLLDMSECYDRVEIEEIEVPSTAPTTAEYAKSNFAHYIIHHFNGVDLDDNQKLSVEELRSIIGEATGAAEQYMNVYDINDDLVLTISELEESAIVPPHNYIVAAIMYSKFGQIDSSGDGKITFDEVREEFPDLSWIDFSEFCTNPDIGVTISDLSSYLNIT